MCRCIPYIFKNLLKNTIIFLVYLGKIYCFYLFFQKFMKKYSIFLWLASIFSIALLGNFSSAEYNLQIDEKNNEVYLASGDDKITLENADKYLSWNKSEENTWSSLTITVSTWSNTNSGSVIWTWTETNSWSIAWTWSEVNSWDIIWTWSEINTWSATTWEIATWTTRTLWENINAELLTWDEFDRALYRMYMNWLTKYNNSDDFRPYDNLTREESAKMIGQLYSVLWFPKEDKWFNCSFVDTNMFDPTLAEHIYNVCRRWIFRGNDKTQQYMPHDKLTKGQLLAVLLRIFEWKMSNESAQPRWIEYYIKALALSMTNEMNLAKFDQPVSRREASLLIFRFKNMIIDEEQYKLYQARLSNLEWDSDSYLKQIEELKAKWEESKAPSEDDSNVDNSNPDSNDIIPWTWDNTSTTWNNVSLAIIAWNETLTDSSEFMESLNWMYDNGMTSYNTTESYMPYQTITRAQVAKMLDKFATATNLTTVRNEWNCEFSDVDSQSEFKDSITKVCQYGVMAWSNDKFSPDQIVTKAEFVAMLIRLFDWAKLDESINPWWTEYYKRAIEIWLISAQDTVSFTSEIARYDVATYLYRLKVRLTMYNNLNSTQLSDEVLKTLSETATTWDDWKINIKAYVDILALNNSAFTDGHIEFLDSRYKVTRSELDSYNVGVNSFVRYGKLYSLETDEQVGSISFILTNWALVEWSIRINKDSYYLEKDSNTTTYYNLTQK